MLMPKKNTASFVNTLRVLPRSVVIVVALGVFGLAALLAILRHESLLKAEVKQGNLAWVLESRLDATFRRIDSDLQKLESAIPVADINQAAAETKRSAYRRLLATYAEKFSEVRRIQVFDADGYLLYSSRLDKAFFIGEHDHFQQLKKNPRIGLFFSEVFTAKTDGLPTMVAARALCNEKGEFVGVITTLIDLDNIRQLLESVHLDTSAEISVRRSDNSELVIRWPDVPGQFKHPTDATIVTKIRQGVTVAGGEFKSADRGLRLYAYRALTNYPFYVTVADARSDILSAWRQQAFLALLGAVALIGALLLISGRMAKSEQNFRQFFASIDDFVFVINANGLILHVNDKVVARLKYPRTTLEGSALEELCSDDRGVVNTSIHEAAKVGVGHGALTLTASDKSQISIELDVVRGLWNGTFALYCVARDVSEQLRDKKALQEEVARRRLLVEQSSDGIVLLRSDGRLVEWNRAFEKMLGYSADELAGMFVWDWDRDGDRTVLVERMSSVGLGHVQVERRHYRKDGSSYEADISVNGVEISGENYMFCFHRDITDKKAAEEALRASEARFREFFEQNASVMLSINPLSGNIEGANNAAAEFYGYSKEELIGMPMSRINAPVPTPLAEVAISAIKDSSGHFEWLQRLKSGAMRTVEVYLTPVGHGDKTRLFVNLHDVTARKEYEARLKLAATVFSHAREGILTLTEKGSIEDVNEAFILDMGYERHELIGKYPNLLDAGLQGAHFFRQIRVRVQRDGQWAGDVWLRRKGGQLVGVMLSISAVYDDQRIPMRYVALCSDITSLKENQVALQKAARYDVLTELPNRVLLADRLQQAMAHAVRRDTGIVVCYLDLDGFKAVNDTCGHDVGDKLLAVEAGRMKSLLREGDTLARLGGDEFAIVLLDMPDISACEPILRRLIDVVALPLDIDGQVLTISVSIGATYYPVQDIKDPNVLLKQADMAMYRAKHSGRNCFVLNQTDS